MKATFKDAKIFIGGIQGSGKTYAGRWLAATQFENVIGFRRTRDFDDLKNMVLIEPTNNPQVDAEKLAEKMVAWGKLYEAGKIKKMPYDCILWDELDLYFQNNYEIGPAMNDLILMHRHYGLAMVFITRRPQDIPARIVESCRFIFMFKIEGANIFKKLDAVDPKIGVLMSQLEYARHNFVFKELGKDPILHKPLPKV